MIKIGFSKINSNYQQEFGKLDTTFCKYGFRRMEKIVRKTCFWDVELESIEDGGMRNSNAEKHKQALL